MAKKLLPMFLACFLLAAGLLSAVSAAGDEIVDKGDCGVNGSNVQWSLNKNGVLTITGTGAISGYYSAYNSPWYGHREIITSLTVSNGVTEIGESAFGSLTRLTKVELPDSLIRIGADAFWYCTNLTKIAFPDSVNHIEDRVFCSCSNLLSFTISDNVVSIGESAFQYCEHLTKIVIPESVENIADNAFDSCYRLKSVTILGECPVIRANTFQECAALTEVTIPDSVLIIEDNAFHDCDALNDVYYAGTEDMWKEISVDAGNQPLAAATIHCDTSPGSAYRIDALTVSDSDGKPLSAIPNGSFLATVSVTNRASGTSPLVFLAAYSDSGKFQDFMYVTVKEPIGGTVEITLPIDNSAGNIAELKAFAVSSFSDLAPLGASVSFP